MLANSVTITFITEKCTNIILNLTFKLLDMKYFNIKSNYGTETVDELNPKDFKSYREFKKELNRLVKEYHIAGINVYISQRCDQTWNKK